MYVDTVTSYGPGMNQSKLEPDFDVDQSLGVFVVPEDAAEEIEEINDDLSAFDYTDEERRELEREKSEIVADAVSDHGLGMGYNLAVSDPVEGLEPGEVLTLNQVEEHEYTGVFGLTDMNYESGVEDDFDPHAALDEGESAEDIVEDHGDSNFDPDEDTDEYGQLK